MSAIALPEFEKDVRAALARVLRGESLLIIDGNQHIANITPTPAHQAPTVQPASLTDFFLNSPLSGSGVVFERCRSGERDSIEF